MNSLLSRGSSLAYKKAFKPILFRQKPDDVHERLLRSGSHIQNIPVIREALKKAWSFSDPSLEQSVFGLTFNNPVGLSAGFDKNFELPGLLSAIGFGFMEGGSLTYRPYAGNPKPWFTRLPKTESIVVYAGLANQGVDVITKRLKSYPATVFKNFPLNISVAKTNSPKTCTDDEAISDYVGSLKILNQNHLGDMYTLNISCPNTYGGEPFTTKDRLNRLLGKVDQLNLTKPLIVKMPSDKSWKEFNQLLRVIIEHKVSGVTICNLAKDRSKVQLKDPLPDAVLGNLSGRPVWELSNALIKKTYQNYGDKLIIIGVGGIFSAEDAYTKIKLGATLVELVTGLIFEGPQLIGQINQGLSELVKKDGYANICEAIGIDA